MLLHVGLIFDGTGTVPIFSVSWCSSATDKEVNRLLQRFALFDSVVLKQTNHFRKGIKVTILFPNQTESTKLSGVKITYFSDKKKYWLHTKLAADDLKLQCSIMQHHYPGQNKYTSSHNIFSSFPC